MANDWPIDVQTIRVLDVLLIAPLMIWGGLKLRENHPKGGAALALFGVTTLGYNAINFVKEQNRRDALPEIQPGLVASDIAEDMIESA